MRRSAPARASYASARITKRAARTASTPRRCCGLFRNQLFKRAPLRIMEGGGRNVCKFCDSGNVVKAGMEKTWNRERQMFKCADCKKRFALDTGFEGRHFDPKLITRAVRTYYKGMSVRDIADKFETEGTRCRTRRSTTGRPSVQGRCPRIWTTWCRAPPTWPWRGPTRSGSRYQANQSTCSAPWRTTPGTGWPPRWPRPSSGTTPAPCWRPPSGRWARRPRTLSPTGCPTT